MSGPEAKFWQLRTHLGLSEITSNQERAHINLNSDGLGTSLIKDGALYSDNPRDYVKGLKHYRRIEPDYLHGRDFVEIKGSISVKAWTSLSHFALNDNMRVSLLRMKINAVAEVRKRYDELALCDQRIVARDLKRCKSADPKARLYVRWEDLVTAIPDPHQNLTQTTFTCNGHELPIKIISGMERLASGRLYVADNEIMSKWARQPSGEAQ